MALIIGTAPAGPFVWKVAEDIAPVDLLTTGVIALVQTIPSLGPEVFPGISLPTVPPLPPSVAAINAGENESYFPPELAGQEQAHEFVHVFLPPGASTPAAGFPVLLTTIFQNWVGGPPLPNIADGGITGLPYAALQAGFAVVSFGMRSAGPGAFFYPPGHSSGRWEDDNYINPYKLFSAAIQWIKSQTKYALDPRNVIPYTASSGAVICQSVCTGADLKLPGLSGQRRQSTAVRGLLSFLDVFDFPALEPTGFTLANNWESVANPGTAAASLADADPVLVRAASTAHWATQKLALAPWTPVFLHADEPAQLGASNDYSTDTTGFPNQAGVLSANIHDAWHAYMHLHVLRLVNPAIHDFSELWVEASIPATAGNPPEAATGTFDDGNFLTSATLRAAAIDWMIRLVQSPGRELTSLKLNPFSGSVYGIPMAISLGSSFGYTADFIDGSSDGFVIQAHTAEVPADRGNGDLTATRIEGEVISTSGDPASFEVNIRPHHHGLHNAMVGASFNPNGVPKQTRAGTPLVWDAPRCCYVPWQTQTAGPPLDASAIVFLDLPPNQLEPCRARVMLRGVVNFRGSVLPQFGPLADLLAAADADALAHGLRVRIHMTHT